MKYLIIAILLIGCVTDNDNTDYNTEVDTDPNKGTIPITYKTNNIDLNITYCREDGNLEVIYGTIGFDTTLYFFPGAKVCLYAEKRDKRIGQSVIVRIERDSSTLFYHKADDGACVSGYLE